MRRTKKVLNKILVIVLLSILMIIYSNTLSLCVNNFGMEVKAIKVIDNENNPVEGINVSLDYVMMGNSDSLNGNSKVGTTDQDGIFTIGDFYKFYGYSGKGTARVSLKNIPTTYESDTASTIIQFDVPEENGATATNFVVVENENCTVTVEEQEYEKTFILKINKKAEEINNNTDVPVEELPQAPEIDCTAVFNNIENLGKVFRIVSNKDSENASITIENAVNTLLSKGIKVISVSDKNGNNVDLNSQSLIGTGYKITTNQGDITVVVYGDATGDGVINVDDINVIKNYFLGREKNISDITNEASDLIKDGVLNSSDIGIMIDSSLKKLDDNILKTDEEIKDDEIIKKSSKLSDVAKVGDYVDYPVRNVTVDARNASDYGRSYDVKWRIFKIENNKVYLVSTRNMIFEYYSDISDSDKLSLGINSSKEFWEGDQETITQWINAVKNKFGQLSQICNPTNGSNAYLDTKLADSTRAFNYDDVTAILGKELQNNENISNNDLIASEESYELWKLGYNEYNHYGTYMISNNKAIIESCDSIDVKVVVELKSDLLYYGGDGTEAKPFEIEKQETKLIDVAQVGDFVNYPVDYKTSTVDFSTEWSPDMQEPNQPGWRVWSIDKNTGIIELVSNSVCFHVDLNSYENRYSYLCDLMNNNFVNMAASLDTKYGSTGYLNSNYATKTKALNLNDLSKYSKINNFYIEGYYGPNYENDTLMNIKQMYGLWEKGVVNGQEYIWGVNFEDMRAIYDMAAFPFGVRTIVELKPDLVCYGGNGTQTTPFNIVK